MSLWLGLTHRVSLVLSQSLPKQKWCSGQVNYSRWPGLMYRITRNKWQDCASLEWRVRLWIRTDEMYVWMLLWSVGLAQCFWWQLYLFGSIGLKGYNHLLLLWFFFYHSGIWHTIPWNVLIFYFVNKLFEQVLIKQQKVLCVHVCCT